MRLSYDHTWIRLAALPERIVDDFVQRFRYVNKEDGTRLNVNDVQQMEAAMEAAIPGKGDLATQWALEHLNERGRLPGSFDELVEQATWYFTHYKEPLFKQAVQNFNEDWEGDVNPKNLLDFTGSTMGYIMEEYEVLEQASQVNTLPEELPDGAELVYDGGGYQIVEANQPQAACELSQGSKWCTKEEPTAEGYLMDSPLYVIYRNQQKAAQLHLGHPASGSLTIELKNVRNRSFVPDDGLRRALAGSGLLGKILKRAANGVGAEAVFKKFAGTEDDPTVRALCAKDPKLAYIYAQNVLHGRFPEGEKSIATQPEMAIAYARKFIGGRFPEAEPRIVNWKYDIIYADMLRGTNPQEYREFAKEHPNVMRSGEELETT